MTQEAARKTAQGTADGAERTAALVGVIVPVYNGESYLQECINSSTFRSGLGVPTGNILTLSTCDYDYANARYVLMGELEPIDDPW